MVYRVGKYACSTFRMCLAAARCLYSDNLQLRIKQATADSQPHSRQKHDQKNLRCLRRDNLDAQAQTKREEKKGRANKKNKTMHGFAGKTINRSSRHIIDIIYCGISFLSLFLCECVCQWQCFIQHGTYIDVPLQERYNQATKHTI